MGHTYEQESVTDALGGNEIYMISSIITPVIDELGPYTHLFSKL